MESRRVNTELSRAMNGNMASAWGGWTPTYLANMRNRSRIDAAVGAQAPRQQHSPIYYVEFERTVYNDLAFRDLSIFPSIMRHPGTLTPANYSEYVIEASPLFGSQVYPFGYQPPGQPFELIQSGVPVVVDSQDQYGEYRIQKVHDQNRVFAIPTTAAPEPIGTGSSASYSFREGQTYFEMTLPPKPGPNPGDTPTPYQVGHVVVCDNPKCAGIVYARTGNRYFLRPTFGQLFPPPTHGAYDPAVSRSTGAWKVDVVRQISVYRGLEVALYDLTLAYTLDDAGDLLPSEVTVELLDEFDDVVATVESVAIDGANTFIDKALEDGKVRRFQRLVLESKYPIYGRARIKFGKQAGTGFATLSNVNLYRGNYLEQILSDGTEKSDFVESQIDVNADIVPKGTIVGFVGGNVCPPGFYKVEGIGRIEETRIGQGVDLMARIGSAKECVLAVEIDQRTSRGGVTDPRTILRLDRNEVNRTTQAEALTYQRSRRLVNIVPYRYDPGDHRRDDHIKMRTVYIGDPHPIWITDSYDRTDIQPGSILELRWNYRRYFMIVSQYAQGRFISEYQEGEPVHPFGRPDSGGSGGINVPSEDRRRAIRQVNEGGADRNSVFQAFQMYGSFIPQYEERALLEVVGDWADVLSAAILDTAAELYVWKSGVLAHAQTHPELGDDESYGGYGYLGEPHSHFMGVSDSATNANYSPDNPDYPTPLPYKHRHGWMFGAATIPKVRPILLCQKI